MGGAEIGSEESWSDLRGFLVQRVRDDKAAAELSTVFVSVFEAQL